MTSDEIKNKINALFQGRYEIDLSSFSDDFKLVELESLNPRLDSMEVAEFLFDVEDAFEIRVEEGDIPTTLGEFYAIFYRAVGGDKKDRQ